MVLYFSDAAHLMQFKYTFRTEKLEISNKHEKNGE